MDITLTMLLDLAFPNCAAAALAYRHKTDERLNTDVAGSNHTTEAQTPIRGIRISGGAKPDSGENGRGLLYLKRHKDGALLSCGGRKIPFETGLSFADTFNKLEEAFIALRDWDMQLHQGIIENKGFQYMLDVSEDIFHRPMAITDSGYKLTAYSKRWQGGDQVFQYLIEKGYLPPDAIDELDKAGFIFEKKAIVLREGLKGLSYPMLNGTIFVEQDYRYMLALLLPDNDFSEGVYELFSYMLSQLTLYVETNGDAHRIRRFAGMSLLADLIEGKCAPAEFEERNRYSGLPEGCSYQLVHIKRKDGTMREFVSERLEQTLPGEIVFIHGDGVYILLSDKDRSGRMYPLDPASDKALDSRAPAGIAEETIPKIIPFINKNHLTVSVSDKFGTLQSLNIAQRQTEAAYTLGLLISQNRTLEKLGVVTKKYDENIFRYSDYFPYDLISRQAALYPAFRTLLADDEKTAAGNLRLLYAYLKNDCSKTRTAAELFMHRNNIIYRIGKLEETFNISLEEDQVKTAFRLSFLALELIDPESARASGQW